MVAIRDKVDTFYQETEEAQEKIVRGSDAHLDIISNIRKLVSDITSELCSLNEDLITCCNNATSNDVEAFMPKLKKAYVTVQKIKINLKSTGVSKDIPEAFNKFSLGSEQMREIIYDLENFRINDNSELDKILGELNDM